MNCQDFQELLFDYLDETLSGDTRQKSDQHLAACEACRKALGEHRQAAHEISARLHRHTQALRLSPAVRQRILDAALASVHKTAEDENVPIAPTRLIIESLIGLLSPSAWRSAIAVSILAAAVVIGVLWVRSHSYDAPRPGTANLAVTISVRIPQPLSGYFFQRQGRFVTDALINHVEIAHEAILMNHNSRPPTKTPANKTSL